MDLLQVVTLVAGLTGTCLKTAMTLDKVRAKFSAAGGSMISTICRESGAISASLSDIQSSILRGISDESQNELHATLDTVILGCVVLYSSLEEDIKRTSSSEHNSNSRTPWRVKSTGMSEEQLAVYLTRIQDQQSAMRILAKVLQINPSIDEKTLLSDNKTLFERIDVATKSLRDLNSNISVHDSLFTNPSSKSNATANETTPGKFDKSIVDTREYQRSRALSQFKATLAPVISSGTNPEEDLIDLSDEAASPVSGSTRLSPLESMWNINAALPQSPPSKQNLSVSNAIITQDAAFHTVRGPSTRDQGRTHDKSRGSSRRRDREPTNPEEQATQDPSDISSQTSLPLQMTHKTLRFTTPHPHEQALSLPFTNTNSFPLTFKVSTTRPSSYAVRPNFGTLLPDQTVEVQFILMEIMQGTDEEMGRRDKFRVQSVPVEDVEAGRVFDWKGDMTGKKVEDVKIKVLVVMKEEGKEEEKEKEKSKEVLR